MCAAIVKKKISQTACSHLPHVLRCLSCVKQAIFLQPCLFDSDDIMLERVGAGVTFPTLTFIHLFKNSSLSHQVQQEEVVK